MMQKNRVGIMGGTFNPIHNGHLLLAELAREYCSLDEILFIPSGNSYMKDAGVILEGDIRISMTALAIADNPHFALSSMEIERPGATYTCDTLKELKKINPDTLYYFIIGADNLFIIEQWKDFEDILSGCVLAVAVRGESDTAKIREKASELSEKYHAKIILLPKRKIDLSSTEIRKRIAQGKSVRYMVPEEVLFYIRERQLYQ